jgi:selenium-binding protein 1
VIRTLADEDLGKTEDEEAKMTHHTHARVGYASPKDALAAPPEQFVYVVALHTGTGVGEPDLLAVVDVNPDSEEYGRIVHRTPMPGKDDELHHYGWQVCSSACHTSLEREHLVVPGFRSSRIHIVNVSEPRRPAIAKVIEGDEIKRKTGLSAPHTVHCMPGDVVVVSMLGDRNGDAPGGFAVLDAKNFDVLGRWENASDGVQFMYDFWYQPRKNAMITSEWAAPNTFQDGFNLDDVAAGKYGHSIHFWDLSEKRVTQSIDLGQEGMIPLEVRWQHDPGSDTGFVGAALSSAIFRWHREDGEWKVQKVIQVEPKEVAGWPFPVPGLITDLVLSMDDRFLYFSDWLHGDLRQYDVSDPANPKLTGQVWLGGVLGQPSAGGRKLDAGPQMLQLSMDGRRLYVTNSLYSTWDNQFYPGMKSWMLKLDCNPAGGMTLDERFYVDFGTARGHEIHLPGGDCTTEIFQ